jgi:hypothetical protein
VHEKDTIDHASETLAILLIYRVGHVGRMTSQDRFVFNVLNVSVVNPGTKETGVGA